MAYMHLLNSSTWISNLNKSYKILWLRNDDDGDDGGDDGGMVKVMMMTMIITGDGGGDNGGMVKVIMMTMIITGDGGGDNGDYDGNVDDKGNGNDNDNADNYNHVPSHVAYQRFVVFSQSALVYSVSRYFSSLEQ